MLKRILAKTHSLIFDPRRDEFRRIVEEQVPGYEQVIADLTSGHAIGVSSHPWRALDILKVLKSTRPKTLVELGGGSSTALFAHYVKSTEGASLLSLDESEQWAELTRSGLRKSGLLPHPKIEIRAVKRLENEAGSYYDTQLPDDIDLLYIDGPSVKRTASGKLPNQDILHHLDKGHRPKAILVDGRYDTARAILAHEAGKAYRFTPGTKLIIAEGGRTIGYLPKFGALHRHSLFVLGA